MRLRIWPTRSPRYKQGLRRSQAAVTRKSAGRSPPSASHVGAGLSRVTSRTRLRGSYASAPVLPRSFAGPCHQTGQSQATEYAHTQKTDDDEVDRDDVVQQ